MNKKHDHTTTKFFSVTLLNAIITAVEFIGGFVSGSLGLVSDAVHNLQDTISIVISYVAHIISQKKSDSKRTFGYKRAEILAAFVNSIVLIVITVFLVIESIKRFSTPSVIDGKLMLIVSIIGLLSNGVSMLILLKDSKGNLNIKSTMLHMLSDTVSSISIVIAAIFVQIFHIYWIDPVVTIVVAIWIMKESFEVAKESTNILMEGNSDIDLEDVKATILTIPEIINVHHSHVWMINENMIIFDAHINVKETETIYQLEDLYTKVKKLLKEKYNISHVTLQAEYKKGIDESMIL